MGTVLGCGVTDFRNLINDEPRPEANRLYTILVAVAIQFIWRTRCTWKIDRDGDPNQAHSAKELHNKFRATLNRTLVFDIATTAFTPKKNRNRRKINIPSEDLVINTWWSVVDSNSELEWETMRKFRRRKAGVLVHIAQR
ncbi:hypothetical protein DFP72DRAFT_817365 [Ephemerocybe angulata]|uniref:Uncharacterized protein n=1 Tax=Ephemerocybe angulata TaxID=980116 RepID=A0A8H6HR04_9AGAR|nr:hypothetical protein DFP72DRAFT_817365 [Tulosesus angulatus]